jgi:AraC-like DNA-binding protein
MNIQQYQFKNKSNLSIEVVEMEILVKTAKKYLLVPHRTNFYHIFLFENCSPKHIVDFENIDIKANSLLFLDKGRVHQFDEKLNYKGKILIFTDDFYCHYAQDAQYLKSNILFNDVTGNAILEVGKSISIFLQICQQINQELAQENDFAKREILKNYVHTFLLLAEREKHKQGFTELKKGADLDYFLLFKDLLEKHFKEIKSVSTYCEKLIVTEKRLNKATAQILGKTPKQMIDERLLLEAKRFLVHETHTIKEIAYELGFDEPTNFIKYFRKHTQKSPSEFRENPLA